MTNVNTRYEVHIKTDAYAGNFEREMFGFVTGMDDTTGCATKEAKQAREEEDWVKYESPFDNLLDYVIGTDEQQPPNHVTIGSDGMLQPGGKYLKANVVIIAFLEQPTDNLISILRRRAQGFCDRKGIKLKGIDIYRFSETKEIVVAR